MFEALQDTLGRLHGQPGRSLVTVGRDGRGTGFVVRSGVVVTNAHNLRGDTTQVMFSDGRAAQARLVGSDVDGDLVALEVDTGDAPAISWGTPPLVGQVVYAVSRGGFTTRATAGVVSTAEAEFRGPRGRTVRGSIEHTAPLPRGSSGGPITDEHGAVVGINTHRVSDGFYVARPADPALQSRVAELVAGRSVPRIVLGIEVTPAHVARRLRRAVGLPERDGLLVRHVEPDGLAHRAGVREGDLIVQLGEHRIAGIDDLHDALTAAADRGGTVPLHVGRGAEDVNLTLTLTD